MQSLPWRKFSSLLFFETCLPVSRGLGKPALRSKTAHSSFRLTSGGQLRKVSRSFAAISVEWCGDADTAPPPLFRVAHRPWGVPQRFPAGVLDPGNVSAPRHWRLRPRCAFLHPRAAAAPLWAVLKGSHARLDRLARVKYRGDGLVSITCVPTSVFILACGDPAHILFEAAAQRGRIRFEQRFTRGSNWGPEDSWFSASSIISRALALSFSNFPLLLRRWFSSGVWTVSKS